LNIPTFLPDNGTIGLVAPSFGANKEPYTTRMKAAIKKFKEKGYKLKIFGDIFGYKMGASDKKESRAKHFIDAYKDKEVDVIWSVGGGELMIEILPFINFEELKKYPKKLYIGYSDNTNLTVPLLTHLEMLTVYDYNFPTFGLNELDESVINTLKLVKGNKIIQYASKFHEPRELKEKRPLDPFTLTEPTKWINLYEKDTKIEGRLIGGVMDILLHHLGTPYDKVHDFIEKYKHDGIVWYLEAFDMDIFAIKRTLWQMREAGWFKYAKGFLFGRHVKETSFLDLNETNVYKDILGNVPIIMNMDIGHVKPMMTLINGSLVTVVNNEKESKLIQEW
jgi:muramoyltetrapeptide carboxypeptidase LdcA involved in peptidoglycan recycling